MKTEYIKNQDESLIKKLTDVKDKINFSKI